MSGFLRSNSGHKSRASAPKAYGFCCRETVKGALIVISSVEKIRKNMAANKRVACGTQLWKE